MSSDEIEQRLEIPEGFKERIKADAERKLLIIQGYPYHDGEKIRPAVSFEGNPEKAVITINKAPAFYSDRK